MVEAVSGERRVPLTREDGNRPLLREKAVIGLPLKSLMRPHPTVNAAREA
jgi:hypothetical protein